MTEIFQRPDIPGAPVGYVDLMEELSDANTSEEARINAVTSIAAISRGKDSSNNPEVRYKKLLTEAAWKMDIEEDEPITQREMFCKNYFTHIAKNSYYEDKYDFVIDFNSLTIFPDDKQKKWPSRAFEFLPVILKIDYNYDIASETHYVEFSNLLESYDVNRLKMKLDIFNNVLGKYGTIVTRDNGMFVHKFLLTNMRAVLNTGLPYEMVPYTPYAGANVEENELISRFKIVKMKIPMFVFNHLVTHTQLSKITKSDRVSDQGMEYWLPKDITEKTKFGKTYDEIMGALLSSNSINTIRTVLQQAGYKKEIWQRAVLEFRYKETIFAGWDVENSWINLLLERGAIDGYKTWAQEETVEVAKALKDELNLSTDFYSRDNEDEDDCI